MALASLGVEAGSALRKFAPESSSMLRFHARKRAVFRPRSCPHFCIFLNRERARSINIEDRSRVAGVRVAKSIFRGDIYKPDEAPTERAGHATADSFAGRGWWQPRALRSVRQNGKGRDFDQSSLRPTTPLPLVGIGASGALVAVSLCNSGTWLCVLHTFRPLH